MQLHISACICCLGQPFCFLKGLAPRDRRSLTTITTVIQTRGARPSILREVKSYDIA
jgi:hypothetical protein